MLPRPQETKHRTQHREFASLRFAACLAACCIFSVGCSAAPTPRASIALDVEARAACVGGLCVHPDHVVAKRAHGGPRARCIVTAWDGEGGLPPTARIAFADGSPARPGIFASIDVPMFVDGETYPIAADPSTGAPGSAGVVAVRVDPAVTFADHRIADTGRVSIIRSGERGDRIVTVNTTWSDGRQDVASFVIPQAQNGCLSQWWLQGRR